METINNTQNTAKLESLFVEVVKASLYKDVNITANMVANTIKHFASYKPFDMISIERWHCICSAHGVKITA